MVIRFTQTKHAMKKALFLFLLVAFQTRELKADLGSCVVYHAKFYLKNGAIFNACFEYSGYERGASLDDKGCNEFCSDAGVFRLFRQKQREDYYNNEVRVYKNLHYISPRALRKKANNELPVYGFVLTEDMVLLDSGEIQKMVFWKAEYTKRYWLTSEIIIGTNGMLDTLSNEKYWNSVVFSTDSWESDTGKIQYFEYIDGPMGGYALYNFNPNINIAELKRLIGSKFPIDYQTFWKEFRRKHKVSPDVSLPPRLERLGNEILEERLQKIKKWFWEKKIVLIAVNGTC